MTTSSDYSIRRFTLRELSALRDLHVSIYGWAPSPEDYKRKYETNSIGGEVIGYLAYHGDEAIAFYAVFPIFVTDGDSRIVAAQSGDTMTHPNHQGKGLFTRLARKTYEAAAAEGVAFVFGFPNANSYPGFTKKLGWSHNKSMRSFNFLVPTLPIGELAHRVRFFSKLFLTLKKNSAALLGVVAPRKIESSVLCDGDGGVLRNDEFLRYKGDGLLCLSYRSVDIYFKLNRFIDVGDIIIKDAGDFVAAWRRLKLLALLSGIVRIRFYTSPNTSLEKMLSKLVDSKEALPYGHLSFDKNINPDMFNFTYLDYDTF